MRIPSTCLSLVLFTAACGRSGGTPTVDAATGLMDGAGTASADVPKIVTYLDVKPLFMSKCVPCHLPGGIGAPFHTLPESYSTAAQPSGSCPGKTIGECTLILVRMGYMPFERRCTGDPAKDASNDSCLTAAEQQLLAEWIAGGLLEK